MIEEDVPKYRKRRKKKAAPRADHKHDYENVLIDRSSIGAYPVKGTLCRICGRLKTDAFIFVKDKGYYQLIQDINTAHEMYPEFIILGINELTKEQIEQNHLYLEENPYV